jgi:hypothetical protein
VTQDHHERQQVHLVAGNQHPGEVRPIHLSLRARWGLHPPARRNWYRTAPSLTPSFAAISRCEKPLFTRFADVTTSSRARRSVGGHPRRGMLKPLR